MSIDPALDIAKARLSKVKKLICLDFETAWSVDYTLKQMTTTDYIRDERFQVIGCAVIFEGAKHWLTPYQFQTFVDSITAAGLWDQIGVLNHHSHFDAAILAWHYGVIPAFYFDTLSMSRAVYGPFVRHDLDSLAQRTGAPRKGNYIDFTKGKRLEDFTDEQYRLYGEYSVGDAVSNLESFRAMSRGYPVKEMALIDMTVRMYTQPALTLNADILRELESDEIEMKANLLAQLGINEKQLSSNDRFKAILEAMGVEVEMKQGKKTKSNPSGLIPAVAKADSFMQDLLEDSDDTIRLLAEARIASKSTQSLTRARRFLKLADGRPFPIYIKYAAAHTHRWGGGDSRNVQNLERTQKNNPKKGRLRKSIQCPPGYCVVKRDSSQIEARFVAYAAGQTALIEAFAQGRDVYSEQGTRFYGRKIDRRNVAADEIPGFVAKVCVLGLGYGMGWAKLSAELLKGTMGGPQVQFTIDDMRNLGIDPSAFLADGFKMKRLSELPTRLDREAFAIHCIVCDYFVNQYRAVNDAIPAYWKFLEKVVMPYMAEGTERIFGPDGAHLFQTAKDRVILPSGMSLQYPNLHQSGDGKKKQWIFETARGVRQLYGAKLLENTDQAVCRIIVADQMIVISDRVPAKLMAHDEVVGVVLEQEAPAAYAFMGEVMKTSPSWAPGLPLASEGGYGPAYAT